MTSSKEVYLIDTAENLIRWDRFHFVDENWGKHMSRENVSGDSDGIILPASDLYLLAIEPDPKALGKLKALAIVDPLDDDLPHKLVTGVMHIHPKEPILIKQRAKYSEGPMEVIKLISRKSEDCATEKQKSELQGLKKSIEKYIAEEGE